MNDFSPEEQALLAAVSKRLAQGPVDLVDLADHLEEALLLPDAGLEIGDDPVGFLEDLLMDFDDVWLTRADLVVSLSWLNNRAIFTKRIAEADLSLAGPAVDDDLIMLDVEFDPVPLLGGGEVRRDWIDRENSFETCLVGIPGWPGEVKAGDLMACAVVDGEFTWWLEDTPGDGAAEAGAFLQAFDAQYRPGVGADLWLLVVECMCDDPSLFRTAVSPLSELLAGVRLRVEGDHVGRADESWIPPGVAAELELTNHIAEVYRFEECCRAAFETVRDGYSDFVLRGAPEDPAVVGTALDHGMVASAFLARQERFQADRSSSHLGFLDAVISGSPSGSPGASYLRGIRRLADADVLGAESDLAEAVRRDPGNPVARVELAWIMADRGDGRRAFDTLGPASNTMVVAGTQHVLAELFAPRKQGRNDPCACGSGRKYKQCCLHHPKLDESDRLRFLSARLVHFVARERAQLSVALSAAEEDDPNALFGLLDDPFIMDLACFEGGGLEAYLDERGPLLGEEDRREFERWTDTRRELYEVEGLERGATLTLRCLRTGDRTVVAERTASEEVELGTYVVSRIVPTPTTHRLIGWTFPVDLRERERLLRLTDREASADEWAWWYRETRRPPTIRNREDEEMVGCRGEFWPADGDWTELISRLDDLYERTDDQTWVETFEVDGGERVVRAFLSIDEDVLVVDANSTERYERVLASLPSLSVILEQRVPMGSPAALAAFMDEMAAEVAEPVEPDAETIAVGETLMREREQKWLDEPVPMLDGLTPREAAADPTRIGDLEKLLALYARMPAPEPGVFTYDVGRLRTLLGL